MLGSFPEKDGLQSGRGETRRRSRRAWETASISQKSPKDTPAHSTPRSTSFLDLARIFVKSEILQEAGWGVRGKNIGRDNSQGPVLWYRRHKPQVQLLKKELEIKNDSKPRREYVSYRSPEIFMNNTMPRGGEAEQLINMYRRGDALDKQYIFSLPE